MSSHTETEIRVMIAMHEQGFVHNEGMLRFLIDREKTIEDISTRLSIISNGQREDKARKKLLKLMRDKIIQLSQT